MRLNLDENCHFINGGSWREADYRNEGIPVLKVSNFNSNGFSINDISFLDIKQENKYLKNKLEINDIVIATVGSHPSLVNSAAGRTIRANKIVENFFLNQNAICLRTSDPNIIDQRFLYFLTETVVFKNFIQQRGKGAANQMRIPISGIKEFTYDFPKIETQRKIASILSGYDDLIENNLKRIKILEEMAQQTYEEWFVRMRFPGYETATLNAETGLPEGWEIVKVKDYVSEISKGPSLKYNIEGKNFPVLNQSCIRNGEIELGKILYAKELISNKTNCYLRINDVLINSMGQGTLGRVSKNVSIKDDYIIHNCITFLRAKKELSQFQLFYLIASKQTYFESIAQGSTGQTTLKISLVEDLDIVIPTKSIIDIFNFTIDPIWKNIGLFKNQNRILKESRDILLPRLMMGVIEV